MYGRVPRFPSQVFGGVEWREEGREAAKKEAGDHVNLLGSSLRAWESPAAWDVISNPHSEHLWESCGRSLAKRVWSQNRDTSEYA